MSYKLIITIISIILIFVGYIPYILNIFKRKTIPHTFTFLVWGIVCSIVWALQVHGGAGIGALSTIVAAIVCIFIFFLSLKYGEKGIKVSDIVFLILALMSLFLWLVIDKPVWSIILIVSADTLGFIPTLRKSWRKPYSETLFTWEICTFRHTLNIFALEQYNILTILSPIVSILVNLYLILILIIKRNKLYKTEAKEFI